MDLRERLLQAWESIADHRRQVAASALGVFTGSAALVLMLAWGTGFRDFMKTTFSHYGRGVVFAAPGITSSGFPGQRAGVRVRLHRRDVRTAERESHALIDAILAEHRSEERLLVEANGRVRRLDMTATDQRFPAYRNFRLAAGRFFSAAEVERARAVAVLGSEAAAELFPGQHAVVGRTIRVNGEPFELIGVLDEKTGRQNVNTHRPDNRLLVVPVSAAEARLGYDEASVSMLSIYPRPGVTGEAAYHAAVRSVAKRGHFHPEDSDALHSFDLTEILGALDLMHVGFTVFIGFAGAITLLVGGVGIANYHLAVLAEREVEIGIAKAIGARNATLMLQSVLESSLVAGTAALLGIGVGLAGCQALVHLAPRGMFPVPVISATAMAITLLALVGVAVVAALVPALRVRQMDVAAALRSGV
jgi:putative ABC transport system permease protein